uniref:Secreted protein n=1 Tax=Anopheles coluzzii TaxID=1518534 RepID=A0A8W7PHH8_ANOCL
MLLTSLLSSACSLAVPSAAQKHYSGSGGGGGGYSDQNHGTLSASSPSTVGTTPSTLTLLHVVQQQQQPERKQHGNHRRPAEPTAALGADGEHEYGQWPDHPDLYNLTLTAMRQYLRNHLNASRYGKAPRKRSHLHVDAVDVEFYRRFKEFNTSQAVLDGVPVWGPEPLPSVVNVTSVPVASSSVAPPATTGQRDYSVLMDDPRGYITVPSSFPLRPGKTSTTWNSTFAQHRVL